MGLISAFKASFLWLRALKHAQEKRYLAAIRSLDDMVALTNRELPKVYLLRSLCFFCLKMDEECAASIAAGVKVIESSKLSLDDKNYMLNYLGKIEISIDCKANAGICTRELDFDIEKVSHGLKENFPLVSS